MIAAVADTHTALGHLFDDDRLSAGARAFLDKASTDRNKIAISSISLAELVYLVEKNRLPDAAYSELLEALANPEHLFLEAAFTVSVAVAMRQVSRVEVPDMPDRMIAATAISLDVPIVSRDRRIRSAKLKTIW